MLEPLMTLLTALGEAAMHVQDRRQRRQDWRTEEWRERYDSRQFAHITGEIPKLQASS